MTIKLAINLSDTQCLALIRLAATKSSTIERALLDLIDLVALDHTVFLSMHLDEFLTDLSVPDSQSLIQSDD